MDLKKNYFVSNDFIITAMNYTCQKKLSGYWKTSMKNILLLWICTDNSGDCLRILPEVKLWNDLRAQDSAKNYLHPWSK